MSHNRVKQDLMRKNIIERMVEVHALVEQYKKKKKTHLINKASKKIEPILGEARSHSDVLDKKIIKDIYAIYANICEKQRQYDKALRLWQGAIDVDPYCWTTQLSRISSIRISGEFDAMEDAFKKLDDDIERAPLTEKPSDEFMAKLFNTRAIYYMEQAKEIDLKQALQYAKKAVAKDRAYAPGWSTLGHVYDGLGERRLKGACFNRAQKCPQGSERFQRLHPAPHRSATAATVSHHTGAVWATEIPVRRSTKKRTPPSAPTPTTSVATRTLSERKTPSDDWVTVTTKSKLTIRFQDPNSLPIHNGFDGLKINFPEPGKSDMTRAVEDKKENKSVAPPPHSTAKKAQKTISRRTTPVRSVSVEVAHPRQSACELWQKRLGENLQSAGKRVTAVRDHVSALADTMQKQTRERFWNAIQFFSCRKSKRELHVAQIQRRKRT